MNLEQLLHAAIGGDESVSKGDMSRRTFLKASAAAGGGLLLSFSLPVLMRNAEAAGTLAANTFAPNAFIRIDRQGRVTLIIHKVEMGQGTYTSMPMLLAEELEVDLSQVQLEAAPPNEELYSDPLFGFQVTGGSSSVRGAWQPLRRAGATARSLLVAAAAETWNVEPAACRAEHGTVIHAATGRTLTYGDLVDKAATMRVPDDVALKDPKDFKLIGTPAKRLDSRDKVDGTAKFGIDVRLPGMKVATVAACPVFGGTLAGVDGTKARAIKGVHQVVQLENAVVVVAENMWAAKLGLAALDIRWDIQWNYGPHTTLSTADIVQQLEAASLKKGVVAREEGDVEKAMAGAARKVEAVYQVPFLAHATMEPMNCTVHVQDDGCDVWVGTQVATRAQAAAAQATGLPAKRVRVHNHLLGGGFGRRLEVDFVFQAAQIAKQVEGPVKVIWTREEDIQHDMYRPYYYDRIAAGLDAQGRPIAWTHRIAGSSIMARWAPRTLRAMRAVGLRAVISTLRGVDMDVVEGAAEPPYDLPNFRMDYVRQEPPGKSWTVLGTHEAGEGIPTAFWRGVGPTHNIFVVESFIDELAAAAKKDPVEYRRALLGKSPRAQAVLDLATEKAGWGQPLPEGHGRGVSVQHAFGSYLAQVAEVAVSKAGEVRVQRVVCAVDCGMTVNPDTVKAQMEGGIIFGTTAALFGEITIKDGRVEQNNFNDYRMLRIDEAPMVEVYLVKSAEAPGGIGEPGTSAIAPAVTNAIFAATGKRIRKLPVKPDELRAS